MANDSITGLNEVLANFGELTAGQLPFAISLALNNTAKSIEQAETRHAADVFDRPTPFTLDAFGVQPATKQDLTASVFIKDAQAKYLDVEVAGGVRGFKTFEDRFESGVVALPGRAEQLDQFGNISKATIKQIAAALKQKRSGYFMGKPKNSDLPAGVYLREPGNKQIDPVLVFAERATYRPRFDFYDVAQATFATEFPKQMQDAWDRAVATMRA